MLFSFCVRHQWAQPPKDVWDRVPWSRRSAQLQTHHLAGRGLRSFTLSDVMARMIQEIQMMKSNVCQIVKFKCLAKLVKTWASQTMNCDLMNWSPNAALWQCIYDAFQHKNIHYNSIFHMFYWLSWSISWTFLTFSAFFFRVSIKVGNLSSVLR